MLHWILSLISTIEPPLDYVQLVRARPHITSSLLRGGGGHKMMMVDDVREGAFQNDYIITFHFFLKVSTCSNLNFHLDVAIHLKKTYSPTKDRTSYVDGPKG